MEHHNASRRKFLYNLGLAGLSVPLIASGIKCADDKKPNPQTMSDENNPDSYREAGKFGVALLGLGGYAGGQLAPALQSTEHCYLAGIVTGTPSKIPTWQNKYPIPDKNVYNYENFDSIKDNKEIDIVYVVTPNALHKDFVIRAAQAGKHVICEKPMATSVEDCDAMIAACKKAGKMLSIGYRLHFEPYNLEMVRLGTKKVYGNIKKIIGGFGFTAGDPTQWRLKKALSGGGPLQDVGIYCIQGICYTTGLEPIAVTAQEGPKTDPAKFKEVEQSLTWQFEMPNRIIAEGRSSYGDNFNFLKAEAEKGTFELTTAYSYSGQSGNTPDGPMNFPKIIQQAKQMDGFALSIKNNQPSIVPGEMGKRDVKFIAAIYEAMSSGKKIPLK